MNRFTDTFAYRLAERFVEHDALGIAAEGAFRFLLSFVPTWILLIALTTVVGLSDNAVEYVVSSLAVVLPRGSEDVVRDTIQAALSNPMPGLLTTSLILTMWTASGVLGTFTKAINRAFDCPSSRTTFVRNMLVSMLLVPIIAIPVTAAAVLVMFGNIIVNRIVGEDSTSFLGSALGWCTRWAVTFALVVLLLALLYKLAATRTMRFRDMLPGALLATIVWIALSAIFREFVASGFARYQIYGSLTAVVLFLFWSYLSAIAFLIGVEFNAELISNRESEITTEGAIAATCAVDSEDHAET
jgi:membrane protein